MKQVHDKVKANRLKVFKASVDKQLAEIIASETQNPCLSCACNVVCEDFDRYTCPLWEIGNKQKGQSK